MISPPVWTTPTPTSSKGSLPRLSWAMGAVFESSSSGSDSEHSSAPHQPDFIPRHHNLELPPQPSPPRNSNLSVPWAAAAPIDLSCMSITPPLLSPPATKSTPPIYPTSTPTPSMPSSPFPTYLSPILSNSNSPPNPG